jgi:hypothetical protein
MSFIRWFVAAVLGLALAYAALVTVVNPRREFGPTLFPEVIPNSRGMKVAYFEAYNRTTPVQGLILGSSTSMQLDPATFDRLTGQRFFNFAVFAGRPEDELAIYRLLRQRGISLRKIILGVDVQAFDPNLPLAGDFSDNIDLRSSLQGTRATPLDQAKEVGADYKHAMSFSYALDILTSLKVALRPRLPEHAFDPNGRIHSPLWDKERAAGTFDLGGMVDRCTKGVVQVTTTYDHLDTARVRQLDDLLTEIRRDSVALVVWLPPFHPRLAEAIAQSPQAPANAERAKEAIEEMARRHGVPLVDLSLISSFSGDTTHWYDCIHYGPDDADRIAALLARHDP